MILATAFDPFGGVPINASEVLLRSLPDNATVARAVLPTAYQPAELEIVRLIQSLRPSAILCFGVAFGLELRLETIARNWDATAEADNAAEIRAGSVIDASGPPIYESTLPLDRIAARLGRRTIPFTFSDDAGGFVCNHTFYVARHHLAQSGLATPCGFIHVPPIASVEEFIQFQEGMSICIDQCLR